MIAQRNVKYAEERQRHRRYYELWARLQAEGKQPIVIDIGDAAAWRAWKLYFTANRMWVPLDLMNDGRRKMTVPCLEPALMSPVEPDRRVKDD